MMERNDEREIEELAIRQHLYPLRFNNDDIFILYQEGIISKGRLIELIAKGLAKGRNREPEKYPNCKKVENRNL